MGCTQATETKDKSIKVKTVPQGKTESTSTKKNQVDAEPYNEKKDQKDISTPPKTMHKDLSINNEPETASVEQTSNKDNKLE